MHGSMVQTPHTGCAHAFCWLLIDHSASASQDSTPRICLTARRAMRVAGSQRPPWGSTEPAQGSPAQSREPSQAAPVPASPRAIPPPPVCPRASTACAGARTPSGARLTSGRAAGMSRAGASSGSGPAARPVLWGGHGPGIPAGQVCGRADAPGSRLGRVAVS
jgi:hypothetical protein